jgi:hypothetical protein
MAVVEIAEIEPESAGFDHALIDDGIYTTEDYEDRAARLRADCGPDSTAIRPRPAIEFGCGLS